MLIRGSSQSETLTCAVAARAFETFAGQFKRAAVSFICNGIQTLYAEKTCFSKSQAKDFGKALPPWGSVNDPWIEPDSEIVTDSKSRDCFLRCMPDSDCVCWRVGDLHGSDGNFV